MQPHAEAMVLASFVADSLALGVHWIYDTAKIDEQFGRITSLLPPQEGSYHPTKRRGDLTHYGDQSLHLLDHLAAHGGEFKAEQYGQAWQSFMKDYSGYMDNSSKETLKNLTAGKDAANCGSNSTDLGGPAQLAPLIYCYQDDLDQLEKAAESRISLTHRGPGVIGGGLFLIRSCYRILHGATPREAFAKALDESTAGPELDQRLRSCLDSADKDVRSQVKEFGQMCAIKSALPGVVYTVLRNEDNLEQALIETVMAGGDSAARGMAVGMLLGARLGPDALPGDWLQQLNLREQIRTDLGKLS